MLKLIAIIVAMATSTIGGKTEAQEYFEATVKSEVVEMRREFKEDEDFEDISVTVNGKTKWVDDDTAMVELTLKFDKNIEFIFDELVDIDENGDVIQTNIMDYILNDEVIVSDDLASERFDELCDEYGYDLPEIF